MSTRLVLIRHAHTESNGGGERARMSGWVDLPLTGKGRGQVERLRNRLRESAFDAVYASPLSRARETALAIPSGGARVERDLREVNCGLADGRPIAEVKRAFPREWAQNLRQEDDDFRWPGGESYREFRARCAGACRRIAAEHEGRVVAVVTHAGVINQVLGTVLGHPPAAWGRFRPENTSLTVLDLHPEGGRLVAFDDHDHLSERRAPVPRGSLSPGMMPRA